VQRNDVNCALVAQWLSETRYEWCE